jgi:uncharacterized protein (TIGR02118 family)
MVKLIALYKPPADAAAFDDHYNNIHAPLAKKMPGLRKLEVSRTFGAPAGEPKYYQMAELYFDDKKAMFAALQSEEGAAAAKDVMGFAGEIIHMMFANVEE